MIRFFLKFRSIIIRCAGVIFGIISLITPLSAFSQYIEIKAELDTNIVTIGDQFNLNLFVNQPNDLLVEFPEFTDTLTGKIEILNQSDIDTTTTEDDRLILTRRILLTSFDSGLYKIPPVPFKVSGAEWSDSLYSNPMFLAVLTVPLDTTIRDIKAPINVPISFGEVYPYILFGLGLLFVGYAIAWYLRKRKRKEPVFKISRPEEPAHVVALRELDRLREEKLWQRSEYKEYYTRLTEIIRVYIEKRFGIPAMEQPSDDTLRMWKTSVEYDNSLYEILKKLLSLADLVKFAKEKPLASDNEINLENAYVFVRSTKPVATLHESTDNNEQEIAIPDEKTVVNE